MNKTEIELAKKQLNLSWVVWYYKLDKNKNSVRKLKEFKTEKEALDYLNKLKSKKEVCGILKHWKK